MGQTLFHQQTAEHLAQFTAHPAHAVLLTGPEGVGKTFAARYVASQILELASLEALDQYPYFTHIKPGKDKPSIGIEVVRDLQQFIKLKLPDAKRQRIILLSDAQNLTAEAQNALLKMLEEPPVRTFFILTATSSRSLLPTIQSRTQHLNIQVPTQTDTIAFFTEQNFDAKAIQQAYMMSGGLPGLMYALLADDEHPLKEAVQTARKLLQSTQFERLCMVDSLSKKKPETLQLLFVLQHMARAAITQSAKVEDGSAEKRIKQWHKVQQAAYNAEQLYSVSAQAKLTLTTLMLSL